MGKIDFLGLNNRLEQHIPFKRLQLVDIKTTQDHFLTRSPTRNIAHDVRHFLAGAQIVHRIAFEQLPRSSRLNLTAFAAWHTTFSQGKMISTRITLVSRIHKLPIPFVLFPGIEKWLENRALTAYQRSLKSSALHCFYTCYP